MTQSIILGGGCFWCIEAIFQRVKGVELVESGYAGGNNPNPTYREVCSGTTGHAEVVKLTYDDSVIKLSELLEIFFHLHNPTTLNQQGADHGTQYRSIVFYNSDVELETINQAIKLAQADYVDPIVTQVVSSEPFYKAEEYHQDYYNQNSSQGYCNVVISPKLAKLKDKYFAKLK